MVIVALSVTWMRDASLPRWLAWFGLAIGAVAILRPLVITHVPFFILSFQPTFLYEILWNLGVAALPKGAGSTASSAAPITRPTC